MYKVPVKGSPVPAAKGNQGPIELPAVLLTTFPLASVPNICVGLPVWFVPS